MNKKESNTNIKIPYFVNGHKTDVSFVINDLKEIDMGFEVTYTTEINNNMSIPPSENEIKDYITDFINRTIEDIIENY